MRTIDGIRADLNISLEELSEKTGISLSTLIRKRKNPRKFTYEQAESICRVLNITDPEQKCEIFLAKPFRK